MAGVKGPLMSFDASGKLADSIVFSKWKGRNYVRQLVTPHNPKSVAQVGMRAMFAFCAQEWTGIGDANQATWEDLADVGNYSPFNAFMKENQANWRDFLAASQLTPITRAGTPAATTGEVATASGRNILLTSDTTAGADQWGVAIFRALASPVIPNWDNCIAVIPAAASDSFSYTDGPLDPDTYYYNFYCFSDDGEFSVLGTEVDDTVT